MGPEQRTDEARRYAGARHVELMLHRPRAADEFGSSEKQPVTRGDSTTDQGGSDRLEAARRLGLDAGHDRLLPERRRSVRRAGRHPHRHAERVRLRLRFDRGVRRADDPHVSHRGGRRRARAGHHQSVRGGERPSKLDQPDASVHRQHARRTPRYVDGLPSPRQKHPRGRGIRREPDTRGDDRGRRVSTIWAPSA